MIALPWSGRQCPPASMVALSWWVEYMHTCNPVATVGAFLGHDCNSCSQRSAERKPPFPSTPAVLDTGSAIGRPEAPGGFAGRRPKGVGELLDASEGAVGFAARG